jgi:hypothetical protein
MGWINPIQVCKHLSHSLFKQLACIPPIAIHHGTYSHWNPSWRRYCGGYNPMCTASRSQHNSVECFRSCPQCYSSCPKFPVGRTILHDIFLFFPFALSLSLSLHFPNFIGYHQNQTLPPQAEKKLLFTPNLTKEKFWSINYKNQKSVRGRYCKIWILLYTV